MSRGPGTDLITQQAMSKNEGVRSGIGTWAREVATGGTILNGVAENADVVKTSEVATVRMSESR